MLCIIPIPIPHIHTIHIPMQVFVTGGREELVTSFEQMMKCLEDGTRNRTTAATKMNQTSSRSHGMYMCVYVYMCLGVLCRLIFSNCVLLVAHAD
ncbi:hypothetical protein EON63_21130 [archaeon]|nr:MAG: hypothetical protein EON63_21130 [archaeon]